MSRARRFLERDCFYHLVFRAKQGIPLPCTIYMKSLVEGCMARTQRDDKVLNCHVITMGNHLHILVVSHKNQQELTKFHMELKKKITEAVKRVLALEHLEMWDGPTSVVRILDRDDAINQIAYLYSNPSTANLADMIEAYPGMNSWTAFQTCEHDVNARYVRPAKWFRYATMKPLGEMTAAEYFIELQNCDYVEHYLVFHPNAWMPIFGIIDPEEVREVNERICLLIRQNEQATREQRAVDEKPHMSRREHSLQVPTVTGYRSKKRERRIFFIGSTKDVRLEFYNRYKAFVELCGELYALWRKGDFSVQWPSCAFIPWCPPLECSAVVT